jgi:ABC-2 type transport system permease protein
VGNLLSLIVKEIRELVRDPKIIIGVILMPLIIFPVMGTAVQISQESVERTLISASFAIYNEDEGIVTDAIIDYLYSNSTVIPIEKNSLEGALNYFREIDSPVLVYIPEGYSENLTKGVKGEIKIYANLKNLNMAETQRTSQVSNKINYYNYFFSLSRIKQLIEMANKHWDPSAVRNPIDIDYNSIIKGNVLDVPPEAIMNLIISQSIMLPVMIMMIVIFAIQMAATSIALEKEQKTLETLMTLPVSRLKILTGKLSGSIVIAIAGALSYMIGFGFYMQSAFSFVRETISMNSSNINFGLSPLGFLLIGLNIFVTLISALAMALSLATFTDSVRGAQSLTGFLTVPVLIPSIILMFTDIDMLPLWLQSVLMLIPYTHSIIASKAAFLGDYFTVLRSIGFISMFTLIVLYIAAQIFSTERILTTTFANFDITKIFNRIKIKTSEGKG